MKHKRRPQKAANPFFKSLLFGIGVTFVTWLIFTLVFSLVLSNMTDHTAAGGILSILVTVFSLFSGGFVMGKIDRSTALVGAVILSVLILALSYLICSLLNLSKDLGVVMKTVNIALMFVSSLVGAKLSTIEKGKRRPHRR